MPDIKILTLDKIGNSLSIDPNTGNLDIKISQNPNNVLKIDAKTHELFVAGYEFQVTPNAETILWNPITIDPSYPDIKSGMADFSNPMQIGKDLHGNIWLRGALTNNTGSAIAANTPIASVPVEWEVSSFTETYDFYQLGAIQSSVAGNTAALFLRFRQLNYKQEIAFSGSWPASASFIIQPTIIGRARYGFSSPATNGNIPNYNNVTWAPMQITNANISNGLSDGSDPMQIGRDPEGNVWLRGAVTNIGTAVAANGAIGTVPIDFQLAGYASVNSFCQLVAVQSNAPGNTTALFFRLRNYNNVQTFAFSASLASGISFMLQPTIIGRAKTPL